MASPTDTSGTGSPESVVTAIIGSSYRRKDGGASTTLYVKESGTGNTGWVAYGAGGGGGGGIVANFSRSGVLATGAGTFRWYNRFGRTLTFDSVTASVGTAPTGAAIIGDVNVNGTTIYTTQGNRPTIAIAGNTIDDTTAPDVTTIADNSYITVDIDQIGSTVPGSDLVVQVFLTG